MNEMLCSKCGRWAGCKKIAIEPHPDCVYSGEYITFCPDFSGSAKKRTTLCEFCARATNGKLCRFNGKQETLPEGAAYRKDISICVTSCPLFIRGLLELKVSDIDEDRLIGFICGVVRQFGDAYRWALLDPFTTKHERAYQAKALENHWLLKLTGIDAHALVVSIRKQTREQIKRLKEPLSEDDWRRLQQDYPGQLWMLRRAKNNMDKYEGTVYDEPAGDTV